MSPSKSAFVVMPFSETPSAPEADWTGIFEHVFQPALEGCGYTCRRAATSTGSLIKSIVESLATSTVVLADVTDQNPNVFYELGVRHALSRRTIIATQHQRFIPSDLRGYWNLEYDVKPAGVAKFKAEIARILKEIEEDPARDDSPVSEFLNREERSLSRYAQQEKLRKLTALRTELSAHLFRLDNYIADKESPFNVYVPLDCLRLLLTTRYVDVGTTLLRMAYELERVLVCLPARAIGVEQARAAYGFALELEEATLAIQRKVETGTFAEPAELSQVAWMTTDWQGDLSNIGWRQHRSPVENFKPWCETERPEGGSVSSCPQCAMPLPECPACNGARRRGGEGEPGAVSCAVCNDTGRTVCPHCAGTGFDLGTTRRSR